jgi:hypothetical protein
MRIKDLKPWRDYPDLGFTLGFELEDDLMYPGETPFRHYCWLGKRGRTLQLNYSCPPLTEEERSLLTAHLRLLS